MYGPRARRAAAHAPPVPCDPARFRLFCARLRAIFACAGAATEALETSTADVYRGQLRQGMSRLGLDEERSLVDDPGDTPGDPGIPLGFPRIDKCMLGG